jgi:hypothetical protein
MFFMQAVYDLLGSGSDKKKSGDRGKGLDIRGGETGIIIPGLSSTVVTDIEQVFILRCDVLVGSQFSFFFSETKNTGT